MLNFAKRVDMRWYVCLAVLALIGLVVFLAIPSKVSSAQAFEAEELHDASIIAGEGDSLARVSGELANVGRELFPSNRQQEATMPGAEKALTGLSLSPEGVYFDGPKGGPFRQSEGSFRVTNTSQATINWSVDDDLANPWAIISSTASGALAPGESIDIVIQLESDAAAALDGGSHTANLTVHNNDTAQTAAVPVNIFVADPLYSTTHPNPNLWFADTTFDASWSATLEPESNRFAWKIDDQPDSAITNDNIADPSVHQVRDVRQVEWAGNAHGTHHFHLVAIDPESTGPIAESLRHYQFNVIADPPSVESGSHPNNLSVERDFHGTPIEYGDASSAGARWIQKTSNAVWSARSGHQALVFQDKLWVMGGYDGGYRNDVWSSPDGKNWTQETSGAGWSVREGHQAVVFQDKLWILGGDSNYGDGPLNDVWSSPDGKNWTPETSGAGWSWRDGHQAVVFQDKLWVLGGDSNYGHGPLNDVWSSPDGRNWTQQTSGAGWSWRDGHQAVVFQDKLWVLGGGSQGYYHNDVWSSPDGRNWTQKTNGALWSARYGHEAVVFQDKLWVLGGENGGLYSDVWFLAGPALSAYNFSRYLYLVNESLHTELTEDTPGVQTWTDSLPIIVPNVKPGEHYFHVAARDTLDNPTPTGHYPFTVGDAVPVLSSSSHASGSTKKDVVLSWTDGGLPPGMLDCWYYEFDNKPTTPVTTGSIPTKKPGETFTCKTPDDYYLHIATYDTDTNLSSQVDYHVQVLQSAAPDPYSDPTREETRSYGCRDIVFKWTDPETVDPAVKGYRYVFDQQPGTDPGNPKSGDTTLVREYSVQNASLGTHYFHVVGQDDCDLYSAPGHFRVNIRKAHAPVVRLELNSTAQLLHFTWTDPENPPFAVCYRVACDKNPRTTPTTELCQTFFNQFDVTESPTPWYLHLIAEDGNTPKNQSDPVHYAVMVGGGMSLAISNPSKEYTKGGEDITYDIIYAGAMSISLDCGDITVHTSDTATATVSCNIAANGNIRTITFPGASISGNGTVYFSLPAGTATGPSGPAPAMDSPPFVVDNTKPAIVISAPLVACATSGPVQWTVTYSDAGGLDWASLSADDVTLAPTGSVTVGSLNVEAVNATTFTVTVDNIQGKGTLGFSISADTAADFAGNMADNAISPACNVDTTPPVASDQTVSLHMNTSKNVDITAVDADDATLIYVITSGPGNGELTGIAPALTYTPQPYFVGPDEFRFTASDGCYTTDPATVTLNVTNTPPVAEGQTVSLHMNTSKAITVVATDADGDPLTYVLLASPTHGTLSGTLPSVTYTPEDCHVGADQFQFRASDGQANSNTATVAITVTNTAPVAQEQTVSVHMNKTKAITVVATDADSDPLTHMLVSGPAHGTLSGTLPNVTYTPESCYVGSDQFTFKANDCAADSNTATVAITVTNIAPVAVDQTVSLHMNTPKAIAVAGTDADSDPLSYALVSGPAHGTLNGTLPNVTYTPTTCYAGPDEFVYTASDCQAVSRPATITISVMNTAPAGEDQTVQVCTNGTQAVTLTGADADSDPLSFALASGPEHGELDGTPPNLTYTPNKDFVGADSFTFTAGDCEATSNVATVSLEVTSVGSATVTIEPEYARTAGAQWSVDSGELHSSGYRVPDLDSGEHVISFTDIPAHDPGGCNPKTAYLTPPDQHITITACADTPITATYDIATKDLAAQGLSGGQAGNLLLLGSAAAALGFVPYSRSAKARTRRR